MLQHLRISLFYMSRYLIVCITAFCLSMFRHSGYVHLLTIVNHTAMNISYCLDAGLLFFWLYVQEQHCWVMFALYVELFEDVQHQLYPFTSMSDTHNGPSLSTSSPILVNLNLFRKNYRHPNKCKVVNLFVLWQNLSICPQLFLSSLCNIHMASNLIMVFLPLSSFLLID